MFFEDDNDVDRFGMDVDTRRRLNVKALKTKNKRNSKEKKMSLRRRSYLEAFGDSSLQKSMDKYAKSMYQKQSKELAPKDYSSLGGVTLRFAKKFVNMLQRRLYSDGQKVSSLGRSGSAKAVGSGKTKNNGDIDWIFYIGFLKDGYIITIEYKTEKMKISNHYEIKAGDNPMIEIVKAAKYLNQL